MNKIKAMLFSLGLPEKEVAAMEVLLQFNCLKVKDLAVKAHLNRSTAYVVLKSLQKKGLVSSLQKYGLTQFRTIEPKLLPSYLERQKEVLEITKKKVTELLPELNSMQDNLEAAPKVNFFEGAEGVKQAYEDTLDNNKGKIIYVFSGPDIVFKEMGKDYVDYYVNKRTRLGIKSLQIAPDTSWGKFIKENDSKCIRFTKLIPAQFAFDTEMVIYDDKLGIFTFTKNKLMAVIIEDESIVNSMLALFRYIDQSIRE